MVKKVIKFVLSGGSAAALNLAVLYLLVTYAGLYYLFATVPAFLVAMVWNFTLQKYWTFEEPSVERLLREFASFALINVVNIVVNMGLMYTLVSVLGLWYIAAQIIAALIIAFLSFLGYERLVFYPRTARSSPPKEESAIQ